MSVTELLVISIVTIIGTRVFCILVNWTKNIFMVVIPNIIAAFIGFLLPFLIGATVIACMAIALFNNFKI